LAVGLRVARVRPEIATRVEPVFRPRLAAERPRWLASKRLLGHGSHALTSRRSARNGGAGAPAGLRSVMRNVPPNGSLARSGRSGELLGDGAQARRRTVGIQVLHRRPPFPR